MANTASQDWLSRFRAGPEYSIQGEPFRSPGIDPIFSNQVQELEPDLDGEPMEDLFSFRATSRLATFIAHFSNQAIDPCVTGGPQQGVADGYWLMLSTLREGEHTLHFRGKMDFFGTPFEAEPPTA